MASQCSTLKHRLFGTKLSKLGWATLSGKSVGLNIFADPG